MIDKCLICGEYVPEGRQICPNCERKNMNAPNTAQRTYRFTVYGKPQPKQRPRFNSQTGIAYTPRETRLYENEVKYYFLQEYRRPVKLEGALVVRIDAYFEPPKSTPNATLEKMYSGEIRPAKKPDADNIIKSICDALNGLAYSDDGQIVSVYCRKLYSDVARCEVTITNERS